MADAFQLNYLSLLEAFDKLGRAMYGGQWVGAPSGRPGEYVFHREARAEKRPSPAKAARITEPPEH